MGRESQRHETIPAKKGDENEADAYGYKESGVNIVYDNRRKEEAVVERFLYRDRRKKEKEELAERLKRFFDDAGGDRFENEREKSPAAKELITFLAKEVPEFAREYGATPIRLREDHIRFMPSEAYDPLVRAGKTIDAIASEGGFYEGGHYNAQFQKIWIRYDGPMDVAQLARTLTHEMLHFQSFQSLVVRTGYLSETKRRMGFSTTLRSGERYFAEIDEAVIEELTYRFMQRIASGTMGGPEILQKLLQQEKIVKEQMFAQPEFKKHVKKEIARAAGGRIDKSVKQNVWEEDFIHRLAIYPIPGKENVAVSMTYPGERLNLIEIVREAFGKNKDRFASEEEVFTLFARASMSGNYLGLARLVEKTFGKGSFRKLGKKTRIKKVNSAR